MASSSLPSYALLLMQLRRTALSSASTGDASLRRNHRRGSSRAPRCSWIISTRLAGDPVTSYSHLQYVPTAGLAARAASRRNQVTLSLTLDEPPFPALASGLQAPVGFVVTTQAELLYVFRFYQPDWPLTYPLCSTLC